MADPARPSGRLRALVRRYPPSCVSAAGDSAASVGPGTAGGAGADRDTVPVLRLHVPGARRYPVLRRCVCDLGRGPVSGLRPSAQRLAVLALCCGREAGRLAGEVLKHIHIEMDAVLVGSGGRCLVVDTD